MRSREHEGKIRGETQEEEEQETEPGGNGGNKERGKRW